MCAVAISMGMAACGGGGGSSTDTTTQAQTSVTFSSVVTDLAGKPVADATVTVATKVNGVNVPESTKTDASGRYTLSVKTEGLLATNTVVVTISKTGMSTLTLTYTDPKGTVYPVTPGGTYGTMSSNVTIYDGETSSGPTTSEGIKMLLADPTALPVDQLNPSVVHLGDDSYDKQSSVNQFQSAKLGESYVVRLGLLPVASTSVNLTVAVKGLESGSCKNVVTVFQADSASATGAARLNATSVLALGTTDATDASFHDVPVVVPATGFNTTTALFAEIVAGGCTYSGVAAGVDDFEFTNVRAKYVK